MAYEVTATRKRPQSFDTMVGQEFVVSTITHAIEQGRIAHAYLFSGPRGVGKTTSARILAKALNCEHGPTAHPCGECASCREIAAGNSPDVIEIDGASNTSVNDIRAIKDEVMFPPQASRYKIYIIDEVHMLSISAFNALLKTIEEPPEYIIFIFATTELQKVPATIRSRCQQFHFQLISLDQVKEKLKEAANDLGVQADDDALFWIAKESTGSMRDAYTLFDQVVSFSGGHITLAGIRDKLGIVGMDQLNQMVLGMLHGDMKGALTGFQKMLHDGISIDQCVKDLTQYYRTLMLLAQGITDEDILGIQESEFDPEVRKAYTNEQLEAAVEMLLKLYRDIRYSLNPRFEVELLLSRLGQLPYLVSPTSLVKRLQALQQSLTDGKSLPAFQRAQLPARQPAAPSKPSFQDVPVFNFQQSKKQAVPNPAPAPEPEPAPSVPVRVRQVTKEDLKTVGQAMNQPMLAAMLGNVTKIEQDENSLTLSFSKVYDRDKLKMAMDTLKQAVATVTGFTGTIQLLVEEPKKEENPSTSDPAISKIASMFSGTIVTE
ncbi:MAG: DNA polymerase III subunit gamma/tau [Sphaerochaetaceae bacterium]|nr:DNA polymerase III subunit gamma/tau [Spirochaetales bacterium]MDY5498730.1 DNA polymerase III subunit gamma/tau [Sphaerochaetaceae bacterium]